MPRLEAGYTGVDAAQQLLVHGPVLEVRFGFDSKFDPNVPSTVNIPNDLIPALIDTGADLACIDDDLAQKLELPIVDQANCSGAGGSRKANMYAAQMILPDGVVISVSYTHLTLPTILLV